MTGLPGGTVTFLFTDIQSSSRLWEQFPDAMKTALELHDRLLRQAIESHRGYIFKTVGDAFCAAFETAPDALAAAVRLQRAILSASWGKTGPLHVREALHTGTAEERGGDYFGSPLNRVSRLLAVGHGGQILLSLAAEELVRDYLPGDITLIDLGEHQLRDLVRPERIFQVAAPDLPSDFPPPRSLEAFPNNLPVQITSFIGRERDIVEVTELIGRVRLLTLTGPGGCGKTRLALQVSADLLKHFSDGVWLIDLAPLFDPSLVAQAVASILDIHEEPCCSFDTTLTGTSKAGRCSWCWTTANTSSPPLPDSATTF